MTVAKRLYIGFGLILAILVAVTVVAMTKVQAIDSALRANNERHALIQRYAINFRGSAHDRSIAIRDVVLSTNADDRKKEVAAIESLAAFYADAGTALDKLIAGGPGSPEFDKMYADIKDIENRTVATTKEIVALVNNGAATEAYESLWNKAKPQYVQWLAAINRVIDAEERAIQANNKIAVEQSSGFLEVMLIALGVALVIGGAMAWSISRSILSQLGAEPGALGDAARRVADGDLRPVPGANEAPEGSVLALLSTMQASLARVVGQVRAASDSIATGSAEIAIGNADLSQRTEQHASNLQQTASSMEQMTSTVKNNADAARQATQLATSASAAAEKGGQVVGEVVSTMNDITASSRTIADIIGVIDGIAFQTNILALNAAVEAARAGEQGRGFAVVAGEVRSLAQRSAEAAKEIKSLIGTSVEKVEIGSKLVGDAGTTMADIVAQVQRVADLISEISSATIEQTSGIAQVSDAVSQLDQSTQQNAALVEQSAAAADSLKQQAAQLADVVSLFKLGTDGGGARMGMAAEPASSSASTVVAKSPSTSSGTSSSMAKLRAGKPSAKPASSRPAPASAPAMASTPAPAPRASASHSDDDWETF